MKKTKLQYLHFTKEILIEKQEMTQKTKLNKTIPLTGTNLNSMIFLYIYIYNRHLKKGAGVKNEVWTKTKCFIFLFIF